MDKDKKITSKNDVVGKDPRITNGAGIPVSNNQTAMTVGPRGPMAMEDIWYMEKMAHFDREVIPERRMHAKGSGAFGTFRVTNDITKYSKAKVFSEIGKETEIFIRFSTVAGERGAADAERDIRGYAIKFYTEDGNWDLAGNNTPVFFLRDPHHFIGLNRAVKRDPRTNLRSANNNWDFWTSLPEALHQITITMSDRGIPASYRHMHGFSSHAYSMINEENVRVYVKFHMLTQQGIKNIPDEEAEKLVGMDRESHGRDLYDAIERGDYPKWKMYIQVMTEEQANNMPYNPFDLTKVWYHGDYPLIEVGEYELNRNPENYFADVEQAAFTPANIVPGISLSPDKMLQGRLFSYGDAHRYRLGINHHQIPVNAPKNATNNHPYHRDGQMRVDGNGGSEVHYAPNSYGNYIEYTEHEEPMQKSIGDIGRWNFRDDDDDYFTQPGKLFNLMSPEQQKVLVENTRRAMGDAEDKIRLRHIEHCYYADEKYGKMMAEELGFDIDFSKFNVDEYKKRKRTDTSY